MNDKPLETRSGNPSLNSRLKAATEIQSSVTPEDYPEEKRELQTDLSRSAAPRPESGKKDARPSGGRAAARSPAEGSDDLPPPEEGSPQG